MRTGRATREVHGMRVGRRATRAGPFPGCMTNSADGLHPGPAGYKAMADKVDLTLFTK
jgi:lysophospholipase L1-like esterase